MTSPVSILGCGWLGRPLAQWLLTQDVTVRGSTTTPDKRETLRSDGIEAVLLTLDPDLSENEPSSFFESPVLVLNIPPSQGAKNKRKYHLRQIAAVREAAADGAVEWVLFASSTSVYPSVELQVTEADCPPGSPEALPGPRRTTGKALLDAEALLMDASEFETTVVRLGGLYGKDRNPGRFLAGRTDVGRPNAPVNLLHQDDAVGVFSTLLDQEVRGEVFNACADEHPSRETFYTRAAEATGLEPPTFDKTDTTRGKLVSNEKIKTHCDYRFRHPDPLSDFDTVS